MYEQVGSSIIIKLQEADERLGFKVHDQVQLPGVRSCRMAFSTSGKFFATYYVKEKEIRVYNSENIKTLIEDIKYDRYIMQSLISKIDTDFGAGSYLLFDDCDKYVAVASKKKVILFSL